MNLITSKLSAKEQRIAELYAIGHKTSDIAKMVFRSPNTVDSYRGRIRAKLNIRTSVEWMAFLRTLPGPPKYSFPIETKPQEMEQRA